MWETPKCAFLFVSVQATDRDSGENARITYELESEWGKDYFILDDVQGTITLLKELDYEEVSSHHVF